MRCLIRVWMSKLISWSAVETDLDFRYSHMQSFRTLRHVFTHLYICIAVLYNVQGPVVQS